ncbi:MAG: hypothetical protein AAF242_03955, partial [Bacteroidota bacterium]
YLAVSFQFPVSVEQIIAQGLVGFRKAGKREVVWEKARPIKSGLGKSYPLMALLYRVPSTEWENANV